MTGQILTVDASALDSYNFQTFLSDFFAGLSGGANNFYGGTPDSAFGQTYYMNGSQVLSTYTDADTSVASEKVALIEGADLAYDFIHHGAAFGHEISGSIDSLTLGAWVEGTSTADQTTGAAGKVTGLDQYLKIDGFGLNVARDAGADVPNTVFEFYNALLGHDAGAITGIIDDYALDVKGSAGDDVVLSYNQDDILRGREGNDTLSGAGGADFVRAGLDDDILRGNLGSDELRGGPGSDVLLGGIGHDVLNGGLDDDILTGGLGRDTFFFNRGSGSDVITDFEAGRDLVDVQALRIDDLSDFTIGTGENGVTLSAGSVTIELAGLEESDLSSDMFLF